MWETVISAGGSLLSGLLGRSSQSSANKANIAMQRETNAQNYRIFQEQNAFNERMWNANNAYNTPEAQKQRYEDAGINPYLAMGNIGSGSSSSSLQSAPAPTMQAPQVMPLDALAQGAQQATQNLTQLMMAQAQIDKTRAETDVIRQSMPFTLDNLKWTSKGAEYGYKLGKLNYDYENQTLGNRINLSDLSVTQAQKQIDIYNRQITSYDLANDLSKLNLDIQNEFAREKFIAEIAKIAADTDLSREQIESSKYDRTQYKPEMLRLQREMNSIGWLNAQSGYMHALNDSRRVGIEEVIAGYDVLLKAANAAGIKLDNQITLATLPYVINTIKNEDKTIYYQSEEARRDNNHYNANNWTRWISGFVPFASGAAKSSVKSFTNKPKRVSGFR